LKQALDKTQKVIYINQVIEAIDLGVLYAN
jgi:hypothetical protein